MQDTDTTPAGRPLMTPEQAAEYLGMTERFLEARRQRGGGPPYVRIGSRTVRYRPEDVEAWVAERTHESTAQEAP